MQVSVLLFGRLAEITGTSNLNMADIADTTALLEVLVTRYPELQGQKILLAVNKKQITDSQNLANNDTVALMPAFSGG